MVAAAGAAGIGEHQDALVVILKACVSARLAEAGRVSTQSRSPVRAALFHDPARPAGDLGHLLGAEALHDLVERAVHGRQARPGARSCASRRSTASRHCTGWPSR